MPCPHGETQMPTQRPIQPDPNWLRSVKLNRTAPAHPVVFIHTHCGPRCGTRAVQPVLVDACETSRKYAIVIEKAPDSDYTPSPVLVDAYLIW
jgi:hypothetical protein